MSNFIPDTIKDEIIRKSEGSLRDVISDFTELKKDGTSGLKGKCPLCNHETGLKVNVSKKIFKCFKCDFSGNNSITYLMKGQSKSYPEALEYLARKLNIFFEEPKPNTTPPLANKNKRSESYCQKALAEVGLTFEDVSAYVKSDDKSIGELKKPAFLPGTLDQYGRIVDGDDIIIYYYDLDGKPITYQKKNSNKDEQFFRVRWQNPSQHLDKDGNPFKYKSPAGGGTHIYIPEKIRKAYKKQQPIKTLFIQEGEKKAEKCCKHGIMSVGISGIHCIASNNSLPHEFQMIIQACQVQNVCFIVDSDWDEISSNMRFGDDASKRPRTFFRAAVNYKSYFRTFYNQNINIEILFGYLNKSEVKGVKGIDDLLALALPGKEADLITEIDTLLNTKEKVGKYVTLHTVTSWNEYKFEQLWDLHSIEEFANRHKSTLENIAEFSIGKHRWKFKDGKFESAQPLENDEQYWTIEEWEDKAGNVKRREAFDYANCFNFLKNRGFGRVMLRSNDFQFSKMESKKLVPQEPWQIRDFITDFTKAVAPKNVLNMIYRGGPQYLGPDKLSNLDFIFPNFYKADKTSQYLYFKEFAWHITADGIKQVKIDELDHQVWSESINDFSAELLKEPLIEIERIDEVFLNKIKNSEDYDQYENNLGGYLYDISKTGDKCHFLKFLENTSNFTWRLKEKEVEFSDLIENAQHFVAKLCAIGFLLHSYKNKSITKAVIGMDGKQSEVGVSNGRSGKSLVGNAINEVIPQCYIAGKMKNLTDDQFLFDGVTEKHKNIFIDDVRTNFDFEFLFPPITGNMMVNKKGDKRFSLPYEISPKFYITTNHALNGDGTSFRDRQWLIAFSDYYNDERKPIDDFGVPFFDDWDYTQRNLFYNLMATCLQMWFRFGIVESPGERLESRRLRQQIGEDFLMWGDEFYSDPTHINHRLARRDLYNNFMDAFPQQRKYVTASIFKKKLLLYCNYKDYKFNPHKFDRNSGQALFLDKDGKPNIDDKTGGTEFFTVGNEDFDRNDPSFFDKI
jgi:DNA primase